jgi:aspartyl aminopeptidase
VIAPFHQDGRFTIPPNGKAKVPRGVYVDSRGILAVKIMELSMQGNIPVNLVRNVNEYDKIGVDIAVSTGINTIGAGIPILDVNSIRESVLWEDVAALDQFFRLLLSNLNTIL